MFHLDIVGEQQIEMFSTEPARLFSMGMTAASTLPLVSAANPQLKAERGNRRFGDELLFAAS